MTKLLTSLAIALTTLTTTAMNTAQADYVKGRVRVDAKGDLNASAASGVFKKFRRAIVLQEVTDGVGVTGYMLLTSKGEVHFKLGKVRNTRCGPVYVANSDSEPGLTFALRDSEGASTCRLPHEWTLEIRKGNSSRLVLEGAPRRYMLTQGGDAGGM
ncbi:MAG: hypothetical protein ACXVBE_15290 [Bdellovibrionota bacterium]